MKLKASLQNHTRGRTSHGDWLDEPADPQHPHEDVIDAIRGGIGDRSPEGRPQAVPLRRVLMGRIFLGAAGHVPSSRIGLTSAGILRETDPSHHP